MNELVPDYFFDLTNFHHSQLFVDIEYVWEALTRIKPYLEKHSFKNIKGKIAEGAFIELPELVSIGKGTIVEPTAYIKGPCIIGENCVIRHGAYIRGNVVVGNNAVIGHATEVKNSIFLDGAQAAHFAYLGDSILGNNVNLGAGTKCANLKLNGENINLNFQGNFFKTGLRKFGAIIGDRAQLGCNCVTNPGTLMGKESFSYPCTSFGGVILNKRGVKGKAPRVIEYSS